MTWRSAGDLGLYEDAEPEPWERTAEDPHRLDAIQAQRERRAREREER